MQLRRMPVSARQAALQAVAGETGCAAIVIVLLASGAGMLLDFQVTGLHPVFSVALPLASVPLALYWTVRRTLKTMDRRPQQADYMRNLALAGVAGQAGCLSVVLIFGMLFLGLFLDSRLDSHPVLTIGLSLAAIPLSLYAMIRLLLSAVGAIRLTPPPGRFGAPPSDSAQQSVTKESSS